MSLEHVQKRFNDVFGIPVHMVTVTPNDSADLANSGILYIGTAGDVKFTTYGGDVQTLAIANNETWLPLAVKRVWATGTTATNIKVCY